MRNNGDVDERWMGSTAASGPEVDGGLARRRCMPQTGSRLAADWGVAGRRWAARCSWCSGGLLVCSWSVGLLVTESGGALQGVLDLDVRAWSGLG